tara:strand:+ start:56 stop:1447 length:1392 start_codon:yes stop_codon:yes gene_type:complete
MEKRKTIFALSTPYGRSAIAVIRLSGPNSLNVAKKLTKKSKFFNRKASFVNFFDHKGSVIDRGLIIFFKAPSSYTGEDMLEIHTHGSIAIINKMLEMLEKIIGGCRFALPGEFSKRAFVNGKNDLIHFEGLANLISSETEQQRIVASIQTFGQTQNICKEWRKVITESLAILDSAIDFPEEGENFNLKIILKNLTKIVKKAKKAVELSTFWDKAYNGQEIVIFGPPNSGKSSFYNLLCQENKAITSSIKGTTRDKNTTQLEIFGLKSTVTDTAGLRKAKNLIEKKGVKKTLKILDSSENFILVLSPDSFSKINYSFIEDAINKIGDKNLVVVYNKNDLGSFNNIKTKWINQIPILKKTKSFSISCKENKKDYQILISLMKFLNKNLLLIDRNINENYYFFEKAQISIISSMIENLEMCIKNIENIEIASEFLSKALSSLDTLYGKSGIEERLELVFNKFCIGK